MRRLSAVPVALSAVLIGVLATAVPAAAEPPPGPGDDGLTNEAPVGPSTLAAGPRPLFQLPFPCSEEWRMTTYPGHDNYDIDMFAVEGQTAGRPILASAAGTVIRAEYDGGGGNLVKIDHGGGWETLYIHMVSAPVVDAGDDVVQGQLLGRVGKTGANGGTEEHLHYEQQRDGAKVEAYFNGVPSGITSDDNSQARVIESRNCSGAEPEIGQGSVTGDPFTDLVATKADGTMWLYSNNYGRDDGRPYSDVRRIGQGWNTFERIIAADATGDGFTDLLGVKSDGTMWLYSNNFARDNGVPYSSGASRQIGQGWGGFNRIIAADATGDGFTDLLALKPDGTMWLYSNNFVRDNGRPYSANRQISHGWNGYDRIIAADATGDGFTDVVALQPDGTMWLYSNNYARDNGVPYSSAASRQIGTGWNVYDRIM
jgi:murein DD-endopeptidase MepM/ murein hydrolase activator NlpD